MTRNLKAFGLALAMVFAFGAMIASAAQAEFTTGSDATTLTAKALTFQQFATTEAEWGCNEISFDASALGTVQTEITVEPTFAECITKAGSTSAEAKIDTNGCHFLLTASGIHILCPEGKQIQVTEKILGTFRECLDIHAQTPTSSNVDYVNRTNEVTGRMDIEVISTIEGITYEKTGMCKGTDDEANDWDFIGKFTLTGDNSIGEPVDITASE